MSWLATIFGTPKLVETTADAIKSGIDMIDKAFYTDQEKAENQNKMTEIWLKLQMILANDNSVGALTRRIIAFLVFSTFVFLLIFACIVYKFDREWAAFVLKVVLDTQLAWIVATITVFFFGLYGWGKYVSKENVPYSTKAIDDPKPSTPRPNTECKEPPPAATPGEP